MKVFCILCISLILCEISLRILKLPYWLETHYRGTALSQVIRDDKLGWKNKPGKYQIQNEQNQVFNLTILNDNSRATSEVRVSPAKEFVLLGDSFTYGYNLDDKLTFPWQLQNKSANIRVTNLGTPGFGTYQSFLNLKLFQDENKQREPHYVYLFNLFHEERNIYNPERFLSLFQSSKGWTVPYCSWENQTLACNHLKSIEPSGWSLKLRFFALIQSLKLNFSARQDFLNKRIITMQIFKEIQSFIKNNSLQFTAVFYAIDDESKQFYKEFFLKNQINFIDCSETTIGSSSDNLRLEDGHPNALANELIANCIFKKLMS